VRVHDVEATVQALAVWQHATKPDTLRQSEKLLKLQESADKP
jgi:hypothetical protein